MLNTLALCNGWIQFTKQLFDFGLAESAYQSVIQEDEKATHRLQYDLQHPYGSASSENFRVYLATYYL